MSDYQYLYNLLNQKHLLQSVKRLKNDESELPIFYFEAEIQKDAGQNSQKERTKSFGCSLLSEEQAFLRCMHHAARNVSASSEKLTVNSVTSFGNNPDEALLQGVYDLVRYDAFFTVFLNKIQAPLLAISSIPDKKIHSIYQQFKERGLELYLANITHDLEIPAFLTIIIDRCGKGPAVSGGIAAGAEPIKAILQSIENALVWRLSTKKELEKRNFEVAKLYPRYFATQLDRALYWSDTGKIKKLHFLINQHPVPYESQGFLTRDRNKSDILNKLNQKNIHIFSDDITPQLLRGKKYFVYRITMLDLQQRYLFERRRPLHQDRLKSVSAYFGKITTRATRDPHFILW